MEAPAKKIEDSGRLSFYGGYFGAIFPFVFFVFGIIFIALSGAPDEKGFWPVVLLALGLSLLLSKDKKQFSETVISGMSESIVMIMIMAWLLASIIGVLMTITGFVEALTWLASQVSLNGVGFIIATFLICCVVSLSTGSSFATILICGPLLYPSGGLLGAHLPTLAGAIIGGATFGDFFAPISDTTIASALSQKVEIGPTVKSRIKYIMPAFIFAIILYYLSAQWSATESITPIQELNGSPKGLPMLLVPVFIIYLFLKGKHLLHGLMYGVFLGMLIGLIFGLLPVESIISLDLENMVASSFIIDGINRAVGISFFTILLMGLVATLKASGLVDTLVRFAELRSKNERDGEKWIALSATGAVMLITHGVVAILMVAEFAIQSGEKLGINGVRRSNILSIIACVFPFLFPYFIPVILMANTTNSGAEFGVEQVGALEVGMHNFLSLGLLIMAVAAILFGYGRRTDGQISIAKKSAKNK